MITVITWMMVSLGLLLIIGDSIGVLPNISSAIVGFMLAIFAIPYYVLSVLIFFPKKVYNAQWAKPEKKNPEIIKGKFGPIDMSNNPLSTYYKCLKCGEENDAFTAKYINGKQSVICKCGEIANEDNAVYKCSKCGKYYPKGMYRCPKCKMGFP